MSSAPAARAGDTHRQVISFMLGAELMGFELSYLEKVIEVEKLGFVPRAPSFVRGAISIRGRVIVVVDMRDFLGLPEVEGGLDPKILILDHEVYRIGLVGKVVRIESVPIRGPLVQVPESGETSPYVGKIVNLGGRILNLVDLEKLLIEIENYFA